MDERKDIVDRVNDNSIDRAGGNSCFFIEFYGISKS
jgi:hypothetical protein